MRVQAWIASHLLEPLRLRALEMAVRSLAAQSEPLDLIWLSVSAEPTVRFPTDEEISLWAGPLPVRVLRHPARRLQFEHLHAIWECMRGTPTWVMFCDDDDLCGPDRVRCFRAALDAHPSARVVRSEMCTFADGAPADDAPADGAPAELTGSFADALEKASPGSTPSEFGAHICHTSVLDTFFEHQYAEGLRTCGGTLDVLFVAAVSREGPVWAKGVQYAYRRGLRHDYGGPPEAGC